MRNKMFLIIGVIVILFGSLIFVTQFKNKQAVADNPYGKDQLHQATIDQLDDPLYDNIILPDDLDEAIESGDPITVYYYSPTCTYCQNTTPVVVPMAEELEIDLKKMNLLEFDLMDYYNVEGTPTIIHYEQGEEVARIVGEQPEEDFSQFFEQYVLN